MIDGRVAALEARVAELLERERYLRRLMEQRREAFWLLDVPGRHMLSIGKGMEHLFDLSRQALLDDPLAFLHKVVPSDVPIVEAALERQRLGEASSAEYRVMHGDGSIHWLDDHSIPIFDSSGRHIRTAGIVADITERKQAAEAAAQQSRLLRTIIDLLPDSIYVKDISGRKTLANLVDVHYMGCDSEPSALGKRDIDVYPPARAAIFAMQDRRVLEDGEPVINVEEWLDADGGQRCLLTSKVPLRDPSGNIVGLVGVGRDITEYKIAQHELEELNRTLERRVDERTLALEQQIDARRLEEEALKAYALEVSDLYNNAPCGYHSLDARGVLQRINDLELAWLGHSRVELVGKQRFIDLLTPASRPVCEHELKKLGTGANAIECEADLLRRDGTTLPVLLRAMAIVDNQGELIGSRWTVLDDSIRRQAQAELRLLAGILEATSDFVATFGLDQQVYYINRGGRELIGISARQEVNGIAISHLVPPAMHRQIMESILPQAIETGRWSGEGTLLHADGREIAVSLVVLMHRDADGMPQVFSTIMRDISLQKSAETALRHSHDELQKANAALRDAARLKNEFMATMSHELRTPLSSILGLAEALQLQTHGALTGRQQHLLGMIETSGRELLSLINDLLDLSRIEAGQLHLELTTFDLVQLARKAVARSSAAAAEKHQQVQFVTDRELVRIEADQRRCLQILLCLLSNAVKFTPEYGELGVTIETDPAASEVCVKVWDRGIGIAQSDLSRLFLPLTQLDSALSRQYPGAGLGLALTKRLVELHGGRIDVQSEPTIGSVFTVTLRYSSLTDALDG